MTELRRILLVEDSHHDDELTLSTLVMNLSMQFERLGYFGQSLINRHRVEPVTGAVKPEA
jgi:hypothetical protein